MVKLWTAKPSQADEHVEFLTIPPRGEPSICVGDGLCIPSDPEFLFYGSDYFDLLLPRSNDSLQQRLARVVSWSGVEEWIARRDTPQSRWLDRLAMNNGHLGRSILELIDKRAITVGQTV